MLWIRFPVIVLAMALLPAGAALAQLRPGAFQGGGQGMARGPVKLHAGIEIRSYLFEPSGEQMKYAVFVPRKLDRSKPAPLVIALHGAGGAPESFLNSLADAAEKHQFIVAAPTGYTANAAYGFMRRMAGPAERENSRLSEIDVMNVLDIMRAGFNIDPRRIYVVGASIGAVGAVHLASKYRDVWAAIGVISPAITSNLPEEFESFDALPVVVLHGDRDDSVPVALVRDWVNRLGQLKVPMQYHEYRGGTHLSVAQQGGEKVFSFLDKYSRMENAAAP
jgi:predicted peptidase